MKYTLITILILVAPWFLGVMLGLIFFGPTGCETNDGCEVSTFRCRNDVELEICNGDGNWELDQLCSGEAGWDGDLVCAEGKCVER